MTAAEEIRANLRMHAALRRRIAGMVADARADQSENEIVVCFEAAEKILTATAEAIHD